MSHRRRNAGPAVLVAIVIVALVAAALLIGTSNTVTLPSGLGAPSTAESTALYCTGFSGSEGIAPATVIFWNTSSSPHGVVATISSTHGATMRRSFLLGANGEHRLSEADFPGLSYYGVSALVSGGGVTATVNGAGADASVTSCASSGTGEWAVAGLSTHVGTTSVITLLNPTSTAAVLNLTTISPNGFAAPQSFQGIVVPAHGTSAVNLGTQIVDTTNVMARVQVLRGSVVAAAATSWTGRVTGAAILAGMDGPSSSLSFPNIPTNAAATAELSLANPYYYPVVVTVQVQLYTLHQPAPFIVTLNAESVSDIVLVPSTRVPALGQASVVIRATRPVVATMATRSTAVPGVWFVSASPSGTEQALTNDDPTGWGSIRLVDPTTQDAAVSATFILGSGHSDTVNVTVPAGSSVSMPPLGRHATRWPSRVLVTSNVPVAIAGALQGAPNGARIVNGSGGGQ